MAGERKPNWGRGVEVGGGEQKDGGMRRGKAREADATMLRGRFAALGAPAHKFGRYRTRAFVRSALAFVLLVAVAARGACFVFR